MTELYKENCNSLQLGISSYLIKDIFVKNRMIMKNYILLVIMVFFTSTVLAQTKIDETEFPFSYVVKLLMYKNGKTYHGTGVMINKNSIITNAHNVYSKDSIHIYPGYSKKETTPFGIITVKCKLNETIFYPKEYKIDTLERFYDFAVIKFDNNEVYNKILDKSNSQKFNLELVESLNNKTIHISGYPFFRWFEFWRPKRARVHYYNFTDNYSISENILLNYKLNTRGGSSGSPLWIEKEGKFIVIGIHKSGAGFKNQGIFYEAERVKLLKKWIDK